MILLLHTGEKIFSVTGISPLLHKQMFIFSGLSAPRIHLLRASDSAWQNWKSADFNRIFIPLLRLSVRRFAWLRFTALCAFCFFFGRPWFCSDCLIAEESCAYIFTLFVYPIVQQKRQLFPAACKEGDASGYWDRSVFKFRFDSSDDLFAASAIR